MAAHADRASWGKGAGLPPPPANQNDRRAEERAEAYAHFSDAPDVRHEFDRNRDPMIAAQMADLDKTEAERRSESEQWEEARRNSKMVEDEKTSLDHKPSWHMRAPQDRSDFNQNWLREQIEAAHEHRQREAGFQAGREQIRQQDRPGPTRSR